MRDQYQLLTVADVHRDTAAIVGVLKGIKEGSLSNDLRLLNYYREIPVGYDATINYIDEDLVELKVHQHQAVVMYAEKMTFLRSSHFPHDVAGKVYKVNIDKCVALLTRFSYAQIRAERRRFVRVEIEGKFEVSFKGEGKSISGRLHDISVSGLSMISNDKHDADLEMPGTVYLSLPNGRLEITGKLLKRLSHDEQWKYVFELETDSRIDTAISQFIFQQQVEIIRELKDQLF